MAFQRTIKNIVSCDGIGVHSGEKVSVTLEPAPADTGVVFIRSDLKENNYIKASCLNVCETSMCTIIKNENEIKVSTIEHLMSALWASGIDNVFVKIDGPEMPIMDGSAKNFMLILELADFTVLNKKRRYIEIIKDLEIKDASSFVQIKPSNKFDISVEIDFQSSVIGKQKYKFSEQNSFKEEIASARTFGFVHEVEYLRSKGLARGASLENAIAIEQDKILNTEGLRFQNEFVRHKILDAIGDYYTIGSFIKGEISGYKTGHGINNIFARKLLENKDCWRYIYE